MIVWDLGGVVATYNPTARLSALTDATGLDRHQIDRAIWGSGLDADAEIGALPAEEVWTRTVAALDHRIDRAELRRCWSQAFVPNPDVLAIIDRIDEPAALFTDNGVILEACLQNELAPLARHFEQLLLSCRLGVKKSDPLAFQRATVVLRTAPAELTLVDDTAQNAQAAQAAGWEAIQFNTPSDLDPLVPPSFGR